MGSGTTGEHWPFLTGGGQMGQRIAAYDWSRTAVGPIAGWPGHMKHATAFMLRSAVPIVMLWKEPGVMVYNDAYSIFAGGRHPQLLGSDVREGWPEVADFNDNVMKVGLAGGTLSYQDQELTLYRSGKPEPVWMNLEYSPLLDDTGEPAGVMAIVVETTAKVRAERRVQGERGRLRQMFEQAPGFITLLTGPRHVFDTVNPAYFQLVGHRDIIGLPVREAIPEVAGQGFFELLDRVYASGEPFYGEGLPVTLQRTPGAQAEKRHIDIVYQPVRNDEGQVIGIFSQGTDVTERVQAQEKQLAAAQALAELNQTLEQRVAERTADRDRMWRLSTDIMLVADFEGAIGAFNPAWTSLLGWSAEDISGRNFMEFVHPDDHAATRREMAGLAGGATTLRFENRYLCKDGGYCVLLWTAVPSEGRIHAVGRDMTADRESAEALKRTEAALHQAQKMESVGQLTGGVAHDFNNLLQVISGNLQLLAREVAGQGRSERYVGNALAGVRRGAKLASHLLAFARRQPLEPKVVNIGRFVLGMEEMLRRTIGESVEIETVISGGLWNSFVDPAQVENALLNLVINARDAMEGVGRLTIEAGNALLDEDYVRQQPELAAGQYVMLAVTDTGSGMSPEVLARVFEPFFSTKPEGKGTGLGLSMVYGFVKQSGGHVKLYSEPGHGTTVKLYLPRTTGSEDMAPLTDAQGSEPGGTETILVAEDDDGVRSTVVEMLGQLGYHVLQARDAASALTVIESGVPIDLLFTDVVMPGSLRSPDLARKARQRLPGIGVLFTSGYTQNAIVHGGRLDAGVELLGKPYTQDALARKIRQVLDSRALKSS